MIQKKICMVGVFGTGKTCLVQQFVHSRFSVKYHSTVGVKIDRKVVPVDEGEVTLLLWDLAGRDGHGDITVSYLRGAHGVLYVVDGTRRETFDQVFELRDIVEKAVGPLPSAVALNILDLLRCYPDLRSRTLFVPGNHDLNIVDRTNTGRFDIPWSVSHALRRLRFVVALDGVQGEHLHIVDRASGTLGPSLRNYLRDGERTARLRELADRGTWRGRWEVSRVWDDIFPLVAPPTTPDGCGAILLDSNARSHFSATNAVGMIARSQLKKLSAVLKAFPESAWLILLHHHIVEYPVGSVALGDRIALSLMNAPDVLAAIARHASRVAIFHGHRHHDWIGTSAGVVLCSAPSVALGSVGPDLYRGSFHLDELALTAGGGLRLASSEHVRIS